MPEHPPPFLIVYSKNPDNYKTSPVVKKAKSVVDFEYGMCEHPRISISYAPVVESADTQVSGTCAARREGSTPFGCTIFTPGFSRAYSFPDAEAREYDVEQVVGIDASRDCAERLGRRAQRLRAEDRLALGPFGVKRNRLVERCGSLF